ncbi:DUF2207 domain-containing protein [Companilactobacillus zhongbaensis]|uniref:DUF2207 domain-containing protein n=1 Tax=Companilactobacillus zhongbaensis TaxID=2486009 RepID=UPI0013DE22DE|nr:DUF2207 domain-containing protein [Companilactobacillus zhongbaensis]
MLKKWSLFLGFFTALIAFFAISSPALAEDSYDINDYIMDIKIDDAGNADVVQKITYDFDGDFNGVYYNADVKGIKSMSDPTVTVEQSQQKIPVKKSNSGANNTYSIDNTENYKKIKIYHKISDRPATFTYRYKINGAVTNYLDTAQINWKVIGGNWDNDIDHAKITFQLPQGNVRKLRAFAHGPLNGETKVNAKKGRVTLTVDNLSDHTFVESRILFPDSVTINNTNVVGKEILDQALQEEKAYAESANQKRARNQAMVYALIPIFAIVFLFLLWRILRAWKNNPDTNIKKPIPLHHWFEIPDVSPSVARMIVKKTDHTDFMGLTGDLLNEVAHKRLDLKQLDHDYEIILKSDDADAFFKFLIREIGDGKSVKMSSIKKSKNSDIYYYYQNWQDKNDKDRNKYFSKANEKLNSKASVFLITTIILAIVLVLVILAMMPKGLLFAIPTALVAIIVATTVKIVCHYRIIEYTQLGINKANEFKGFRQMLRDINDINVAEVGDLILWEQILPYAAAFGVSKKVIDALKLKFGEQIVNDEPIIGYYYFGLTNYAAMTNFGQIVNSSYDSFDKTLNSDFSSTNGYSGGGFSGGNSGGFGGGSGGGAF